MRRPFRLPEYMKYVALLLAAIYFVFWLFGGLWYSKIGNVEVYYWLGWVTLLAYLPLLLVPGLCRGQAQPGMRP